GECHIIPNAAVIVLSLLYGGGDFSRSINICNMCGWDTDCNVANVGTIMGVRNGLDGIDDSWRKPINDFLCCSSVIGTLNILDIPWCASYIASFGYKIANADIPAKWRPILTG
ncbi:ADP-ribosylglycohydrolase family protein, partial [Paenibacillus sepulcri]|nr:ADP-ribosylglycohydrolase family protein [Paenibacillus sepulcri]